MPPRSLEEAVGLGGTEGETPNELSSIPRQLPGFATSPQQGLRSAADTIVDTAASAPLPAIGAGAGAALGTLGGPAAPVTVPLLAGLGGYLGGKGNQALGITEGGPLEDILNTAFSIVPELGAAARSVFGLKSAPAVRGIRETAAREAIANLQSHEARTASDFYKNLDALGNQKVITVQEQIPLGDTGKTVTAPVDYTWDQAQQRLQALRKRAGQFSRGGQTNEAAALIDSANDIETALDKAFPGYSKAKGGYAESIANQRAQRLATTANPLRSLETDLATSVQPDGSVLLKEGGRVAQRLPADQVAEIKNILRELGPDPSKGLSFWKRFLFSRVGGGALGAMLGGPEGHTAGMVAGLFLPDAIDAILAKALQTKVGTSMIKHAILSKTIDTPAFWRALAITIPNLARGATGQNPSITNPAPTSGPVNLPGSSVELPE